MTLPAVSHTIRIINLLTKQERRVELEHTSLSLLQPTIAMLLQSPSVPYILVTEDGKIVKCFYDEIFADHTSEIVYDDLKQFYRQSKYESSTYEDPFPTGWDRHAWLVCFRDLSNQLNAKVCKTQDLFDIEGLPCVEGPDMGVVWDKPRDDEAALISNSDATARSVERPRSPVWNNYLRMAKVIADAIAKDTAKN